MDLWDVTKLMWRRWYVTAPMLLVTATAAIMIFSNVGPEYRATGHVAVVPSQLQRQAAAGEVTLINPWNEEALAQAATIRLEGSQLAEDLAGQGYQGEWGVEVNGFPLPVLTIEVVSPTSRQAVGTLRLLQTIVEEEVADRQGNLDLPDNELITTVRLDEGESIETTSTKVRRALVAVVGAGIIFTIGAVIVFDAVARWLRARSHKDQPPEATAMPADAPELVRPRYSYATGPAAAPLVASINGGSRRAPGDKLALPVQLRGERAPAAVEPVSAAVEPVSAAPGSEAEPDGDQPEPEPEEEATMMIKQRTDLEDSTIVLPLSNAPWAGRPRQEDWPPAADDQEGPDGAKSR